MNDFIIEKHTINTKSRVIGCIDWNNFKFMEIEANLYKGEKMNWNDMNNIRGYSKIINDLMKQIHTQAVNAGWWNKSREDGTILALIHSEISECLEGIRKDLMDNHLKSRKMAEVELADTIIRILDFCAYKGYDIGNAVIEKLEYNQIREDHKLENRMKEGGKAF